MHKKNIIHCDLKYDNAMFVNDNNNYRNSFTALKQELESQTKLIDFDGCIYYNNHQDILDAIEQGYMYHPTTPAFAHPYLLERMYFIKDRIAYLKRLQTIEAFRRMTTYDSTLEHIKYHGLIFSETEDINCKSYNGIFRSKLLDDPEYNKIVFQFCDYYNLTMSFLYRILMNEHNNKDHFIKSTCDLLRLKARPLKEYLTQIDQKTKNKYQRGGNLEECPIDDMNSVETIDLKECLKNVEILKNIQAPNKKDNGKYIEYRKYIEFGLGGKTIVHPEYKEDDSLEYLNA